MSLKAPIITLKKHRKSFRVYETPEHKSYLKDFNDGVWEPLTFEIFDAFLDPHCAYIDIGAFIGTTVLYGCQLAKHTYALEPDPVAFRYLEANVALNPDLAPLITLSPTGLYTENGEILLGESLNQQGGMSTSSLFCSEALISWKVPSITFDSFIRENKISEYNFIKMDIEGAEAFVLPDMQATLKRDRPTLFLALHPPFFNENPDNIHNIIDVLNDFDHVFTADGREIRPTILSNIDLQESFYEVVATYSSIEKLLETSWGQHRLKPFHH